MILFAYPSVLVSAQKKNIGTTLDSFSHGIPKSPEE